MTYMIPEMTEYFKAQQNVKIDENQLDTTIKNIEDDQWKIRKELDEKIRKLEDEKREKVNELEIQKNKSRNDHSERMKIVKAPINKVHDILTCMSTPDNTEIYKESEVYQYARYSREHTPVFFYAEIMNTDAVNLVAVIIENDRPKNNYSLGIIGNGKFTAFHAGSGNYINIGHSMDKRSNVEFEMKVADNIDDLIEFFNKNIKNGLNLRNKLISGLNEYITSNEEKEAKFKEYKVIYKLSDFDSILSVRCEHCNQYSDSLKNNDYYENKYGYRTEDEMARRMTCPNCKNKLTKIEH